MFRKIPRIKIVFVAMMICVSLIVMAGSPIEPGFHAAYLYLENSASGDDHNGDFDELQGVANGEPAIGDPYWYFSRNTGSGTVLFSAAYSEHLKNNFSTHPKTVTFPPFTDDCSHVGDLDYFAYDGTGYLLAGFDNCIGGERGYIGIFRADEVEEPGNTIVPVALIDVTDYQINQVLWVCVDSAGTVYSGSGKEQNDEDKNNIYSYVVDWEIIKGIPVGGSRYIVVVTPGSPSGQPPEILGLGILKLFDENGDPFIKPNWQGADFSTDDLYFYFSEGALHGGKLHVFQRLVPGFPNALYRVRASKNVVCLPDDPGCMQGEIDAMPFKFQVGTDEEPEGLSYFDMNGVDNYHSGMPRSELHVISLDNCYFPCVGSDTVYIKHYSAIVDVSSSESISGVYYLNPAWDEGIWDGAIMRLQPGEFIETPTISGRNVKFVTWDTPGVSTTIK